MAAKTPVSQGTAGYCHPWEEVVGHDLTSNVLEAADVLSVAVGVEAEAARHDRRDAALWIGYFADIDDGDTFASGFKDVIGVAWQADGQNEVDIANATCLDGRTGTITFDTNTASDQKGWLWILMKRSSNPNVGKGSI